jgi:hypothetical protein
MRSVTFISLILGVVVLLTGSLEAEKLRLKEAAISHIDSRHSCVDDVGAYAPYAIVGDTTPSIKKITPSFTPSSLPGSLPNLNLSGSHLMTKKTHYRLCR